MEPSDRSSGCWGHALPLLLSPCLWVRGMANPSVHAHSQHDVMLCRHPSSKGVQPLALPTCEPRGTYFFAGRYVRRVRAETKTPAPMLTVIFMSNKFLDCLEKIKKKKLYSIQRSFLIFATVFNPLWLAESTDTEGQLDLTGPLFQLPERQHWIKSSFLLTLTGALQTSWNTYPRQSLLSSRGQQTRNKCRDMVLKWRKSGSEVSI